MRLWNRKGMETKNEPTFGQEHGALLLLLRLRFLLPTPMPIDPERVQQKLSRGHCGIICIQTNHGLVDKRECNNFALLLHCSGKSNWFFCSLASLYGAFFCLLFHSSPSTPTWPTCLLLCQLHRHEGHYWTVLASCRMASIFACTNTARTPPHWGPHCGGHCVGPRWGREGGVGKGKVNRTELVREQPQACKRSILGYAATEEHVLPRYDDKTNSRRCLKESQSVHCRN